MNNMKKTVKNPTQCWLVVHNYTQDVERECSTLEEAQAYAGTSRQLYIHDATYEGMDREYVPQGAV